MSMSNYLENELLDHVFGVGAFTQPSGVYVKLHLGDPGEDGTGNPATETTRVQGTFGSAASGGTISNTAQVQWTGLAATETLTHVSLWDASTSGNCLWAGPLASSVNVNIGGTFTIPIGDLDVSLD
jgi:hypothetical protein